MKPLSQGNVCYFESPASKKGGRDAQQGPEGGMSRAVGENPPACRVVRLNESHHHSGNMCQELAQANNVACGGADWEGN